MTVFRWLNNNIGCIEIRFFVQFLLRVGWLNNNMGCIEIIENPIEIFFDLS